MFISVFKRPLGSNIILINPINAVNLFSYEIRFNIIQPSTPKALTQILPSASPTKIWQDFLVSRMRNTSSMHLSLLDFVIFLIISDEEYRL
jgi:hypothetical protein